MIMLSQSSQYRVLIPHTSYSEGTGAWPARVRFTACPIVLAMVPARRLAKHYNNVSLP